MKTNEIRVRYNRTKFDGPRITSPDEAFQYFQSCWPRDMNVRESFLMMMLDASKKVLGHYLVSVGSKTATIVDPALVFGVALKCMAHSIVIAHNHPSGNLTPSQADIQLTNRMTEAGRLLSVSVEDHIIMTPDFKYTSMRSSGLM
jgi:DNA repair protein RadC